MSPRLPAILCFGFLVIAVPVCAQSTSSIRVTVSGLRSSEGEVRCALFRSPQGFPRKPEQAAVRVVAPIRNGSAQCEFQGVASGPAAISVIHDKNANQKLDFKFGFIPAEGVGWSNNPKVSFAPPSFEASRFLVGSQPISMTVNLLHR